jgi:hypothetical protein
VSPGAVLDMTKWQLQADEAGYITNLERVFDKLYGAGDKLPRGTRDAKGQLYVSERMGAIVEPYGQTQTQQRISMASPSKQFSTRAEAEAAFVAAFGSACLERPEVQRALDAAYPK